MRYRKKCFEMNSPCSKLQGITSASLRYADDMVSILDSSLLQAAGNSNLE
jgi:hypothetical protein